jgi:hypothetical protein
MNNLFEMIANAQGGNAINNLANQYGLSPDQAQSAIEALLPALSMGMQQKAQSADGLETLLQSFGGGQHAAFHDADGDGIPDDATPFGNDVLGQVFGSKDVSRAVAQQASFMSGVPAGILKQMLPVIASMVMGGMFKSAMGNGLGGLVGQVVQGGLGSVLGGLLGGGQQQQPQGGLLDSILGGGRQMPQQQPQGGGLGDLLGQMMGGGRQAPPPQPQGGGLGDLLGQMMGGAKQAPPPQPQGGGLGDLLGQMMGGAKQAQPPQPQGGGLGDLLGQMMGGGRQAPQQAPQSSNPLDSLLGGIFGNGGQQQQQMPQQLDPLTQGLDMLKGMFQPGVNANQQYQDSLAEIFRNKQNSGY